MRLAVYLPLLFSAMFGVAAPMVSRRMPPNAATWLLSVGSLVAAAGSSAALGLLALTWVGQVPLLAAHGHWAPSILQARDPVAPEVAALALAALSVLAVRAVIVALRRLVAMREAGRLAAVLPTHGGELAVIDSPEPAAYAVPGRPGRIVVSTGLLRRLDGVQRRAVLAHERAHLDHRHHLHQSVAALAAAANPLLGLVPGRVAASCERWADEDAAATSHRQTVAEALTRAATGALVHPAPAVVLAGVVDVAGRVGALREPPPRPSGWRVVLLVGLLAGLAITVGEAAHDAERLFEVAKGAYRAGLR